MNDLNYDIDLLKIDYPMSKVGYCNFWVGNQSFWDKYMAFTLPIYSYVLYKNKNMYEIIFKKMFHLNGSTYYPYIFERLLTVLVTIDTSIKAYKIPSTQDS